MLMYFLFSVSPNILFLMASRNLKRGTCNTGLSYHLWKFYCRANEHALRTWMLSEMQQLILWVNNSLNFIMLCTYVCSLSVPLICMSYNNFCLVPSYLIIVSGLYMDTKAYRTQEEDYYTDTERQRVLHSRSFWPWHWMGTGEYLFL